jgi:hypothetical protein
MDPKPEAALYVILINLGGRQAGVEENNEIKQQK